MNIRYLLALLLAFTFPAMANAASLLEVYQQALQSDPLIHEAEARRLATLEAVPQARGSLFPQLSAGGSWSKGSRSGRSAFQDQGVIAVAETESDSESFGWGAELRQSIFRWGYFARRHQHHGGFRGAVGDKVVPQNKAVQSGMHGPQRICRCPFRWREVAPSVPVCSSRAHSRRQRQHASLLDEDETKHVESLLWKLWCQGSKGPLHPLQAAASPAECRAMLQLPQHKVASTPPAQH